MYDSYQLERTYIHTHCPWSRNFHELRHGLRDLRGSGEVKMLALPLREGPGVKVHFPVSAKSDSSSPVNI